MMMMKNIENKGIRATDTLKNEVAGKTKPLFGLAKGHIPLTLCAIFLKFFGNNGNGGVHAAAKTNVWGVRL
jgi:hypothetical protein